MNKAKFLLSAIGIISAIAGVLAMKTKKKYTGSYFCTAVYSATARFQTRYSTLLPFLTLYCSLGSSAKKTLLTQVGVDA